MPQGRRKTPFSGKAKKDQLKAKKNSKLQSDEVTGSASTSKNYLLRADGNVGSDTEPNSALDSLKINRQPDKARRVNRYALQFYRETDDEIRQRKEAARGTITKIDEDKLEIEVNDFFDDELDFPKRPEWSFESSRDALERRENRYFAEYVKNLETKHDWKSISFFELNLETWRQLWRVLEMSDVILFIVDIRFPALMFPPNLYKYVTDVLKKRMILVLNKIDLAPSGLVAAWKNYFEERYPELEIVMFTTIPGYNLIGTSEDKAGLQVRRRKGRVRMAAEGTKNLFEACKRIVANELDLTSWERKITEETRSGGESEEVEVGEKIVVPNETGYYAHEKYKDGVLTVGCLGQPNVGKSSLINAIMGKKVVSVSKTPGHTKHFQTIFLTENVKLCDCPGLVFPSRVPKVLQVLMGSYPIAQLREAFTAVKYLAERLNLPELLRIQHPDGDEIWSAMDVCDGWARKRGFLTAKAARLDSNRAANHLLRMSLDGKLCLRLYPPGYANAKGFWAEHRDVSLVNWIKANSKETRDESENGDSNDEGTSADTSDESVLPTANNKFALLDVSDD